MEQGQARSSQGRTSFSGSTPEGSRICPASSEGAATAGGSVRGAGAPGTPEANWRGESRTSSGGTREGLRSGLRAARAIRTAARLGCCLGAAVTVFLASDALAQKPARYTQKEAETLAEKFGFPLDGVAIRIVSADVLDDKSIRINLVISNDGERGKEVVLDPSKIQLVSDSLDRVQTIGKPEGQFRLGDYKGILLAPHDAVKASLKFPSFPEPTKTANLVFYAHAVSGFGSFQLRGIALFIPGQ